MQNASDLFRPIVTFARAYADAVVVAEDYQRDIDTSKAAKSFASAIDALPGDTIPALRHRDIFSNAVKQLRALAAVQGAIPRR